MIPLKEVTSTAIKAIGYDPATRTLAVRFRAGQVSHYADVPQLGMADHTRVVHGTGAHKEHGA